MKYVLSVLALCLCLPVAGAETPPTPKEIAEVKASAEKGDAQASGLLARYYHNGLGLKKDIAEALKWARSAAQKGDSNGQNILGSLHHYGQGVEQDFKEALKWYQKAADQGNAMAQNNLASLFHRGKGVEKDHAEAFKWFRKAADQGVGPAQAYLGNMFMRGLGVKQDYAEAIKWHRKAAEQGASITAKVNRGTDAERVASLGWSYAQLGWMYQTGNGVKKDVVTAHAWYNIADANGYTGGKKNNSNLAKKMTPDQITKAESLAKEMVKKNPKLLKK